MDCSDGQTVHTTMPYLARDRLYSTEKPFGADFRVDHLKGSQSANHIFERSSVAIHDIRKVRKPILEQNGFCFFKAATELKAEDATNEENTPTRQYLQDIQRILYERFPEYCRIEVMDFQVRKRDRGFPQNVGENVTFQQPAAVPHVDFSIDGAFMRMKEVFPGQEKHYVNSSFDLLNVWRVLRGPNDDWPLALCDYQSVDLDKDVVANDCLHEANVGENWLLHANENHRWFYMSGQEEDDLIVFRNIDSEGILPRGFHCAFNNPLALNCCPRHSIEVRVVAIRRDLSAAPLREKAKAD